MMVVKVACGNAYVASSVGYHYVGAFIYTSHVLKDGRVTFGPGKLIGRVCRSRAKAERIGREYAAAHSIKFISGYGSLFGHPCEIPATAMSF